MGKESHAISGIDPSSLLLLKCQSYMEEKKTNLLFFMINILAKLRKKSPVAKFLPFDVGYTSLVECALT